MSAPLLTREEIQRIRQWVEDMIDGPDVTGTLLRDHLAAALDVLPKTATHVRLVLEGIHRSSCQHVMDGGER